MNSNYGAGSSSRDQSGQQEQQPFQYDISNVGHYGASAALVANSSVPPSGDMYGGAFANVSQGLTGQQREILTAYWQQTISDLETKDHDYKMHQLPLARIKKVMKADPDVKMISAEAPILFAKGCDIFITELTMRAWIHAEENKRRTLQRSDIASALTKSEMFDFLIDIVPREDAAPKRTAGASASASAPPPQQQQPPPPQQPQQPQSMAAPEWQEPARYGDGGLYGPGQSAAGYGGHTMYGGDELGGTNMYGYPAMTSAVSPSCVV
ncbi:histone-fold-containing protein [Ascodesmis nigricans]|uniref:Histone-fold-containing protein n=1 Tax=Ascodesmis nigricans TaxID=341454 RepID=A0A4S2N189_9PEZI|nr:histone-fold-containing protein [Ascodesmis nigricans]